MQRDTAARGIPAYRYRVQKGTPMEKDVLMKLGETNTGDPKVLADFLDWGLKNYPAKRTMAVLWNHGSGWDDTDVYAEARRRGLNPAPARRSGTTGRAILPPTFVRAASHARKRFRSSFSSAPSRWLRKRAAHRVAPSPSMMRRRTTSTAWR